MSVRSALLRGAASRWRLRPRLDDRAQCDLACLPPRAADTSLRQREPASIGFKGHLALFAQSSGGGQLLHDDLGRVR